MMLPSDISGQVYWQRASKQTGYADGDTITSTSPEVLAPSSGAVTIGGTGNAPKYKADTSNASSGPYFQMLPGGTSKQGTGGLIASNTTAFQSELAGNFTMMFAVRLRDGGQGTFAGKGTAAGETATWIFGRYGTTDNQPDGVIYSSDYPPSLGTEPTTNPVRDSIAINDGGLHLVVIRVDNTNHAAQIFVDGRKIAAGPISTTLSDAGQPYGIGCLFGGNYPGAFDLYEHSLWNRLLTVDEINLLSTYSNNAYAGMKCVQQGDTYLVMEDSIGEQPGQSPGLDYQNAPPKKMGRLLTLRNGKHTTVVNVSKSGWHTGTEDNNSWNVAKPSYPAALTLAAAAGANRALVRLGLNDARLDYNHTPAQYSTNMTAILAGLLATGMRVVSCYPTPPNDPAGQFNQSLLASYLPVLDAIKAADTTGRLYENKDAYTQITLADQQPDKTHLLPTGRQHLAQIDADWITSNVGATTTALGTYVTTFTKQNAVALDTAITGGAIIHTEQDGDITITDANGTQRKYHLRAGQYLPVVAMSVVGNGTTIPQVFLTAWQ